MSSRENLVRFIRQAETMSANSVNKNITSLINHMYSELAEYDSWQEKLEKGTQKEKISASYWLTQGQGKNIELGFHNYIQSIWYELGQP
jgi:hypothetical protein